MTKAYRLSLGIAVTALLVGCDQAEPAANAAANTANVAVAAEPAAPVANTAAPTTAAAADGALSADFMVGKWSATEENCAETLEFRKDGTVVTPFGNAKWALNGDKLAVDFGEGSKVDPSTIKALGPDRIEITKGSGNKETQKRC